MKKPSYYAITAIDRFIGTRAGREYILMNWYIVTGPHATREEARAHGEEKIRNNEKYASIALNNMIVVSKSQLRNYRSSAGVLSREIELLKEESPDKGEDEY